MTHELPFTFYTERRMVLLTGRRAKDLAELQRHLQEVPGSSVFYHTHHQYLAHHFEKPLFHDDFSLWISGELLEERLSEKLTALNLLAFTSIRQLREAMIETIGERLGEQNGSSRECVPGREFHFCESQSFAMSTGLVCRDVPEFFSTLRHVSNISLFFHFFEARLRLERPTNDFSCWLCDRGEYLLAQAIDDLNPYAMTLDELRQQIIRIGEEQR